MNQILAWLAGGDLRSDGLANEAAQAVLQNPHLFDDLYQGLSAPDDVIRGRAADALEKVAREKPDLLVEHLPQLVQLSQSDPVPMVKMHLAMIFGHLSIYPQHVSELRTALFELLEDESVFAKSWAIASLCILGRKFPVESQAITRSIAPLKADPSVAVRSKVRNALTILSLPTAPFPKGWIKSEHLKDLMEK